MIWEVVYNHVVDETKENDNRGLCGYFNKKDKGGDKRIIKYVSLFINVNETSDWGLGE